jgi:hypothetical protein
MTGYTTKRIVTAARTALVLLSGSALMVACGDDGPTAPAVDPVSVETRTLPEAIEGRTYSHQLAAAGGRGAYSWVIAAGSLPGGLTLSPAGVISGTPVGAGSSSFRVRATDADNRNGTGELAISVVQALAVHTTSLPEAQVGVAFAAQIQPVGGRGTLTWTLTGNAATWLTVSANGALSGVPTVAGASSVTVTVTDQSGQQVSRTFPIDVREPLAVAAATLPVGTEGRAYAAQLVAVGGSGTYTWTVANGALPAGLTMTAGGAIVGMPTGAGEFTFTAQVTDGAARVATRAFSLTVERAPTIQTATLAPAEIGVPYAAQLAATGGTGAYTWSVAEGTLPVGLTLSPGGAISGTPTATGSASVTVRVTDEAGRTHTRAFTLVVAQIQLLATGVAVEGISGAVGSVRYFAIEVPAGATRFTAAISGGTGDADLYIRRGALPQEFVYDCRPLRLGNEETCTVTAPASGFWYIMLRGHADFAGVRLVATYEP